MIYAVFPAEKAVHREDIDSDEYLICSMTTATDLDFHVKYDSMERGMAYTRVKDRTLNSGKLKFSTFDPMYNLNTYVIYPKKSKVYYSESGYDDCIEIYSEYDAEILYPIERELFNDILPKGYLLNFETWF